MCHIYGIAIAIEKPIFVYAGLVGGFKKLIYTGYIYSAFCSPQAKSRTTKATVVYSIPYGGDMHKQQDEQRLVKNFHAMSDKKREWFLAMSDWCVAEQEKPLPPLVVIIDSSTPGE